MRNFLFTSESVTEGHPDKMCDIIADSILDEILKKDKTARVACEVMIGNGYVIIGGEITSEFWIDVGKVARKAIKEIGYIKPEYGFDWRTVAVFNTIREQSLDIAMGVKKTGSTKQGAGDQGMCIGYACNETPELMPFPIMMAHKLAKRITEARNKNIIPYLRPDGKSQVTVEYSDGKIKRIDSIVISVQHDPNIPLKRIRKDVVKNIINPICSKFLDKSTKIYINNTGRFIIGGPVSDTGVTGRKIVVDSYGGIVPVGGGSFSGKDPTKVDRSGAYIARYVAKNIIAAGLAEKCLIRLAYIIGGAKPVEVSIDTFNTSSISEAKIANIVPKIFDLSPAGAIKQLNLLTPCYKKTAAYGHFGRKEFSWEKTDKALKLKKLLK